MPCTCAAMIRSSICTRSPPRLLRLYLSAQWTKRATDANNSLLRSLARRDSSRLVLVSHKRSLAKRWVVLMPDAIAATAAGSSGAGETTTATSLPEAAAIAPPVATSGAGAASYLPAAAATAVADPDAKSYAAEDTIHSFPALLRGYTVELTRGLDCSSALGGESATRTFLDLFIKEDSTGLLLHHTQTSAGGADTAFVARRPPTADGKQPRRRLFLVHVDMTARATTAEMLEAVKMGNWYRDYDRGGETPAHAAFRELLASHRDFADPVRVLVSPRPWAASTRHVAEWINDRIPDQPVILAQITQANLGLDITPAGSASEQEPPTAQFSNLWWPTPVRHWPADLPHPQASLPPRPPAPFACILWYRVAFTSRPYLASDVGDLHAAADAAGEPNVLAADANTLVAAAEEAVQEAEKADPATSRYDAAFALE